MATQSVVLSLLVVTGQFYLLVGGFSLIRKGVQPRVMQALGLYALAAFLWTSSQLPWHLGGLPFLTLGFTGRLPLYGLLLQGFFFLHFVRAYLRIEGTGWGWWSLGLGWTLAVFLLDANPFSLPEVLWSGPGWAISRRGSVLVGIGLGWVLSICSAVWLSIQAFRQNSHPSFRNRIKYLILAFVPLAAGDLLFLLSFWTAGSLAHLAGVLVAVYAAATDHLASVRQTVLRFLSVAVTRGMLAALYFAFLATFGAVSRAFAPEGAWLGLAGAALILAIFYHPLLNRLESLVDHLIAGVRKEPQRVLREYSQSIGNILELKRLSTVIVDLMGAAMETEYGFLFLVDQEQSEGRKAFSLRGVQGKDGDTPKSGVFPADSPLSEMLGRDHRALTQYDIDHLPPFYGLSPEERSWLADLRADIYVPIHARDRWIGLLVLGPKASGAPYLEEEQELLATLAGQTAVALENARLVESLMRLNKDFRRAITALNQANQHLEKLDRTKSDFIQITSQELNTPLEILIGYSRMLLEDPSMRSNPKLARILSGIQVSAQRLHEILESMLDMAKLDARDLEIDPRPVSIPALIGAVREGLKKKLDGRDLQFENLGLSSLPEIEADPDALSKVFQHLIANAVKYTPDGGRITISGHSLLPSSSFLPRGGVEIVISDTGIGVDPRLRELIFRKFYQTGELSLRASTKLKFRGAGPGLGLAICRGIVEAHGGKIWVESPGYNERELPGSHFHMVLPVRQPVKEEVKVGIAGLV